MRKLFAAIIFLLISLSIYANENVFGLRGLVDLNGNQNYEWAGYSIVVEKNIKTPKIESDISKIKKHYEVTKSHKVHTSENIKASHQIIVSVDSLGGAEHPELVLQNVFYLINTSENKSDLLFFQKIGERDVEIENRVIQLFLSNQLSTYLIPLEIESIDFVGRYIPLGNTCKWQSPNNLNCMGGQISWSEFDSYQKAETDNELRILKNRLSSDNLILDEDNVPVVFEGEQVFAKRFVYQSLKQARNYPLIVYYIATEVDGHFVSCILSHYGYSKDDYELPDLLKEVMHFEQLPDEAWNKYDYPVKDVLDPEQQAIVDEKIKESKYDDYFFLFKSGVYIPIGKRKDILGKSVYFDLSLNWTFHRTGTSSSSAFVNLALVFPNDRKTFEFSDDGLYYDTKTDLLGGINLGFAHTRKLMSQLYWNVYGKIGFNALDTDIAEGTYDDGRTKYKTAEVFSLGAGTSLRFQRISLFFEYQFAPYGSNKHMRVGGNSAFMTGLGFAY